MGLPGSLARPPPLCVSGGKVTAIDLTGHKAQSPCGGGLALQGSNLSTPLSPSSGSSKPLLPGKPSCGLHVTSEQVPAPPRFCGPSPPLTDRKKKEWLRCEIFSAQHPEVHQAPQSPPDLWDLGGLGLFLNLMTGGLAQSAPRPGCPLIAVTTVSVAHAGAAPTSWELPHAPGGHLGCATSGYPAARGWGHSCRSGRPALLGYTGDGGGERCRAGPGGSHLVSSTCRHSWSVRLFHTRGANCYFRVPLIHNSLMSSEPGLRFTGGRVPRQPLSGQYLFTSLPSSREFSGQTPFPSYVMSSYFLMISFDEWILV